MANHDNDFTKSEVLEALPADQDTARARAMVPAAPQAAPAIPGLAGGTPTYSGPEILNGGLSQTWLLNCLRRRWLMTLLLGLLAAGLVGGTLAWLLPESYRTTAYMKVNSKLASNPMASKSSKMSAKEWELFASTTAALIKNPLVLESVINNKSIKVLSAVREHGTRAITWLTEDIRVSYPGKSEVLEIRYDGPESPADMVKVVNAICVAFQEKVTNENTRKAELDMEDVRKVSTKVKKELRDKTLELEKLAEAADAGDKASAALEARMISQQMTQLKNQESKLLSANMNLDVNKTIALAQATDEARLEQAVQGELDKDTTLDDYRKEAMAYQRALRDQGISKNRQTPQIVRLRNQLAQIQQEMTSYRAQREKEIRKDFEDLPNNVIREVMIRWRLEKSAVLQQLKKVQEEYETQTLALKRNLDRDPKLALLRADIDRLREADDTLSGRIHSSQLANTDRNQQVERLTLTATAQPNLNTMERVAIAGIGGLSALGLTCYGIALWEFRRRRLNGPTDLDEGLGVRVLGVLPSTTPRKSLAGGSLAAAQTSEAIDNVRATLMHDSTSKKRQVVLVTTAQTLDGCTTVAANLATSLARAGRRTLLIDGDLRSPSLHKLFGVELDDGFSEVLRAEAEIDDVIRPTSTEGLYVITAGLCDSNAIHALATDQPQPIFEKLRAEFDFIIMDSAPVLCVSDSLSLGQYADGAILSTLRDHSELRNVNKALELLDELGIRVLGTVVNGVNLKADERVVRLHKGQSKRQAKLAAPKGKTKKAGKASKKAKASKADEPAAQPEPPATTQAVAEPPAVADTPLFDQSPSEEIELDDLDMDDFDIDNL